MSTILNRNRKLVNVVPFTTDEKSYYYVGKEAQALHTLFMDSPKALKLSTLGTDDQHGIRTWLIVHRDLLRAILMFYKEDGFSGLTLCEFLEKMLP